MSVTQQKLNYFVSFSIYASAKRFLVVNTMLISVAFSEA